jgi:hypothetical protein
MATGVSERADHPGLRRGRDEWSGPARSCSKPRCARSSGRDPRIAQLLGDRPPEDPHSVLSDLTVEQQRVFREPKVEDRRRSSGAGASSGAQVAVVAQNTLREEFGTPLCLPAPAEPPPDRNQGGFRGHRPGVVRPSGGPNRADRPGDRRSIHADDRAEHMPRRRRRQFERADVASAPSLTWAIVTSSIVGSPRRAAHSDCLNTGGRQDGCV